MKEIALNGNECDFPVNYGSIKKKYILNNHKYLMKRQNTDTASMF